ncbi:MAG: hypothetical protein MJE77_45425 [Proteobacteria bacterium]|nr:hypothetical protein [Pseudomonadota bacterium]
MQHFLPEMEALYAEWQQKVYKDGHDQGRKAGRQEGRRTGRDEGYKELLVELLVSRFGPLSEALSGRKAAPLHGTSASHSSPERPEG